MFCEKVNIPIINPFDLIWPVNRSRRRFARTLRLSNNFSKPYRVLKTTISDKSLFQQYYNNTNLTLDYVIRYHFYTSIDLNSEKNQLISMDGTKFNLSSKNAKDLTYELITLVSKMYVGRKEFIEFKKLNKNK